MPIRLWALLACWSAIAGADTGSDLLAAAKKGQAERVRALVAKKAPLESKDKNGKTPLMLAAQYGHAEVVRFLLDKGASTAERDHQGLGAYGLALLSSSAGRAAVLKVLPEPQRMRVRLEAESAPDNLYSSCFMSPPQLAKFVAELNLGAEVLTAVREAASNPGVAPAAVPLEFVEEDGDAVAALKVRPQASCVQQESSDNLSLAIDARVTVTGRTSPALEKTFGGGLKGLHARKATSPAQYAGLFSEWAKSHARQVYWAIVEAVLKQ